MGDEQQRLREQALRIREGRPAVSRASRVTALFDHRGVRVTLFFAAVGAFLGLIGAFGVDDVSLLRRITYYSAASMTGAILAYALHAWSGRLRWIDKRRLVRLGFAAIIAAPVMGLVVWTSEPWLTSVTPTLSSLPNYLLVASGMATAMTLLAYVVFGRTVSAEAPSPRASLSFRLPVALRSAEIWALQAEDHYLRVHTARGSALILMRLSDAVAMLEGMEGAQTHRSWWVARSAIAAARRIDERAVLTLPNGDEAPVSRKFAPALRQAGWF